MFPGRPNIDTLLGMEMEQQVGAMGVSVCGPGALSDEVRLAVRRKQYHGTIGQYTPVTPYHSTRS